MPKLHRASLALAFLVLTGCGGSRDATRTAARPPEPELDWAMLLPIETDAIIRVDLARIRRSPHRDSMLPVVEGMIGNAVSPGLQPRLGALLERTDEVLIALMPSEPPEMDEDVLVLARGRYGRDVLAQLQPTGATPSHLERRTIDGHEVHVETDGPLAGMGDERERALVQLRSDTVVVTDRTGRIEDLIARTRMRSDTPRWPPSLRELVQATGLERATLGLAVANRDLAEPMPGEPVPMSMAGIANADAAFDLELLVELHDPGLAAATAVLFDTIVHELGSSAEEHAFALRQLARSMRFETQGTRVHGTAHADATEAAQLVPGLMGLLRDGMLDGAMPPLGQELPTPVIHRGGRRASRDVFGASAVFGARARRGAYLGR
jgi:hypothetical protein